MDPTEWQDDIVFLINQTNNTSELVIVMHSVAQNFSSVHIFNDSQIRKRGLTGLHRDLLDKKMILKKQWEYAKALKNKDSNNTHDVVE